MSKGIVYFIIGVLTLALIVFNLWGLIDAYKFFLNFDAELEYKSPDDACATITPIQGARGGIDTHLVSQTILLTIYVAECLFFLGAWFGFVPDSVQERSAKVILVLFVIQILLGISKTVGMVYMMLALGQMKAGTTYQLVPGYRWVLTKSVASSELQQAVEITDTKLASKFTQSAKSTGDTVTLTNEEYQKLPNTAGPLRVDDKYYTLAAARRISKDDFAIGRMFTYLITSHVLLAMSIKGQAPLVEAIYTSLRS